MNTRTHVEALKSAADPAQVARALGLQERGRRFFCPSCQPSGGKTPDLAVGPRGWRCFKCGSKGDALALVQFAARLDFPAAVAWLEGLTGLPPEGRRRRRALTGDSRQPVAAVATKAQDKERPNSAVFAAFLAACRPVEGRAIDWLVRAKGIAPAVVTALGLRFCGREYGEIMATLTARFGETALLAAGLLTRSRAGRLAPSFWSYFARKAGFVVIPYRERGEPVYVKVRPPVSKAEAERRGLPRFLNAGGTVPCLYNVDVLAAEPRPDAVLICEGESDTWAALSAGRVAVGSPGARLFKPAWVEAFRPFQRDGRSRVFLVPDADAAGAAGARMIAGMFKRAGLPVPLKVAIPDGQDLNDFLRQEGGTA